MAAVRVGTASVTGVRRGETGTDRTGMPVAKGALNTISLSHHHRLRRRIETLILLPLRNRIDFSMLRR
jgi:hypothetical protein